jgi:hypothetical protein
VPHGEAAVVRIVLDPHGECLEQYSVCPIALGLQSMEYHRRARGWPGVMIAYRDSSMRFFTSTFLHATYRSRPLIETLVSIRIWFQIRGYIQIQTFFRFVVNNANNFSVVWAK